MKSKPSKLQLLTKAVTCAALVWLDPGDWFGGKRLTRGRNLEVDPCGCITVLSKEECQCHRAALASPERRGGCSMSPASPASQDSVVLSNIAGVS